MKIRTAVVGVGALGQHHLKWLAQIENSDLVGFFDVESEKRKKFSSEYPQIRAFDSLEELSQHADAVSIVVPTSEHFKVASLLIENGLHCLIEKPVTATLEEAQKLLRLSSEQKVIISVGQIERFNPAVQSVLDENIRPAFIEAHRLAAFDPRGTDVAVVRDLMIHDIDLVLTFMQREVVDVQASAVGVVSEQADIANARLTFDNGAVANLTASRISLQPMRKLRIFQQASYVSLDLLKKQADLYRLTEAGADGPDGDFRLPLGKSNHELVYSKKTDSGIDMLKAELESFLASVRGEQIPAVTLQQGTDALKIALTVEEKGKEAVERMLRHEATS